jgi:hypothetical protein
LAFAGGDVLEERKREEERRAKIPKEELVKDAKKILFDHKDFGHNGIAIHIRRGRALTVDTGPCHGFVRNMGGSSSLAIVTLVKRSHHERKQVEDTILERYLDFVMNRSPWASCFEDKNAKDAVRNKCVELRTDVPANLLQGALMTTRHTWEMKTRVELWYALVGEGVDERIAFLAMNFAFYSISEKVLLAENDSDHSPINPSSLTGKGVASFMTSPRKDLLTGGYNKGGDYRGVMAMWSGGEQPIYNSFHRGFIAFGTSAPDSMVVNPFIKAKRGKIVRNGMSVKRFAAFVTEFFGNIIKKQEVS